MNSDIITVLNSVTFIAIFVFGLYEGTRVIKDIVAHTHHGIKKL